ncbi:MAG: hypothetical protein A3G24_21465 [Betaproteobacteria bacterium RIFCSPLOWO2_12_FULL_62_13]|nr:MAG: hypothetical protein A3G24_21465 [Betaproteobacteria bacterium RIFCSPLOWO2_12_FULL_62_13]
MHKRFLNVVLAFVAAVMGLAAGGLAAQSYPTKIIRVVNAAQPGGNADILFRLLAPRMGEILGQQLVIDYRPGAGTIIGSEIVARSAPDGYTTLVEKLNSALVQTLRDPSIRKALIERGAGPVGSTPEEHAAYIKSEIEKWRGVVKAAGIKPE